jgi:predicted ATP-dependent protease
VALTGEGSLTGKVLPVTGLRGKLLGGAKESSASEERPLNVVVPATNMRGSGAKSLVEPNEDKPHEASVLVRLPASAQKKLKLLASENLFDSIKLCLLKTGHRE